MSNTTPTPIVDKNGKQTTVHKKNDGAPANNRLNGVATVPTVPTTPSNLLDGKLVLAFKTVAEHGASAILLRVNTYSPSDPEFDMTPLVKRVYDGEGNLMWQTGMSTPRYVDDLNVELQAMTSTTEFAYLDTEINADSYWGDEYDDYEIHFRPATTN